MMRSVVLFGAILLAACAPSHLGTLSLGGERDLQTLILGGWDGRRLVLFNDVSIEPFRSTPADVAKQLKHLDSSKYAAIYFETAKLPAATASAHSIFCPTPACIAVIERNGGSSLESWGEAVAIVELRSLENQPIGAVWIQDRAIRPPGPGRWPLHCRNRTDPPRYVHPDGAALYPANVVGKAAFALFGPTETPAAYRAGFSAPSETLCDEELVRRQQEPPPETPEIKADPALMQK